MNEQRKKELLQQYKEMKTYYGVVQLKNEKNGKIFIDTVPNTKNRWGYYKINLNNGNFMNKELQQDWKLYGEENFSCSILWEKDASKIRDMKYELKKLKKEWLDKLEPYGERGYNSPMKD